MKAVLYGDMHGTPLDGIINVIAAEDPDAVFCLGDFDTVEVIHQQIGLEEALRAVGKTVLTVPGNHDYALIADEEFQSQQVFEDLNTSYTRLRDELREDTEACNYILRLLKTAKHTFDLDPEMPTRMPTILIHAGLDGCLSTHMTECPDFKKFMWYRLKEQEHFEKNFAKMEEAGITLMLRGHDHNPGYALKRDNHVFFTGLVSDIQLDRDTMFTITPGAYRLGHYVLIDTSSGRPIVSFRQVH